MEAVVSMLILGILLTTVVSIIRFSLVMTGNSVSDATAKQDAVNTLITTDFAGTTKTLSFKSTTPGIMIDTSHSVTYLTEDGITVFRPDPIGGDTP